MCRGWPSYPHLALGVTAYRQAIRCKHVAHPVGVLDQRPVHMVEAKAQKAEIADDCGWRRGSEELIYGGRANPSKAHHLFWYRVTSQDIGDLDRRGMSLHPSPMPQVDAPLQR